MKINEKNLAAFASSNSPVDREGWLQKRGELNKGFQKRWFVLKGNLLFYFEKQGDKEPLGVVILEGCTIEISEDEEHFIFKIAFHGPGNRNYILGADTQESMEQWMKALAFASYDYMKIMVADLQRQLDEIDKLPTILDSSSIQRVGVAKEGKSPNPPPRQRQNPFNKTPPIVDSSHYQHQRSLSLRIASDGSVSGHGRNTDAGHRTKATFRDLHNSYGRRILADFNEWKHGKRQVNKDDLLIAL